MKRGDYVALLLFLAQAGLAYGHAHGLAAVIPPLGDLYFQVPLHPLSEALSSIRTLGYPLFHAAMASLGHGLGAYPEVQMLILIPCVLVFWLGLRAYGLTGPAALAAVSPALWMVPVEQVIPETLAKCFAIAAIGFVLWAAGRRSITACVGAALAVFAACQMRPAFLFLVVFIPFAWLFLYTRRWGLANQTQWLRQAFRITSACAVPLLLFCLVRLAVVGHFGLVSFGGQNTIGIAIEMLDADTVAHLPAEDRPLAQALARGREAWPAPRFLTDRGVHGEWRLISDTYAANINRTARNIQAKFPAEGGKAGNVAQDQALSRLSTRTFLIEWKMYLAWLAAAALESARAALDLLLGGGGSDGFKFGTGTSLTLVMALILLMLLSWPMERRAFGEGSRPHFSRAAAVLLFITGMFFIFKMLLVILVEPPIPRYVEAAAFLLPCAMAALFWDRAVVLTAALCGRPWWYSQCYLEYPVVPDVARPLPWRAWAARVKPGRRSLAGAAALVLVLLAVAWWCARDNRLFRALEKRPDSVRGRLMREHPPVAWRARDGATALHYAALNNDGELLAHLLKSGAEASMATRDGATALHWAALGKGDATVVAPLLDAGLATDAAGPLGMTPVHLAALFGNAPALEALLARGANPNAATPSGVAPLHMVGSVSAAEALLRHGAEIDARDGSRATPLMWAHNRALATLLLDHGADINAREHWRSFVRECTPLTKAAYQSDDDTARWLLDRGADPNVGDINDMTPLYYAIWRRNYPLAHLLLDRGADPNHPGRWASYHREKPTARYTDILLKTVGNHAKRDNFIKLVPDEALIRPLDWAAFLGDTTAIEILLARGARLDQHNDAGMSPLHWALLAFQKGTARMLRSADPASEQLDDPRLPIAAFEAAVAAGYRDMNTPATPPPPPEVAAPPSPAPALEADGPPVPGTVVPGLGDLRAAAQRRADEFYQDAPNIFEAADGFLFTRQACTYLLQDDLLHAKPGDPASGPLPALTAISDIHRQLASRGIDLIVVPAPVAIEVHADAFVPGWLLDQPAFPARAEFIQALRDAGVHAMDLLPLFIDYRRHNPDSPLYLKEDGHWNSTAIGIAAEALAGEIRNRNGEIGLDTGLFSTESIEHRPGLSSIAKRLAEDRRALYADPVWSVVRVLASDGTPLQDDPASPVLVAGDSFTLMFSEISGHLSARLAEKLGRTVAFLGARAAGPVIPRALAREGKAYIDARKVIIWVFSSGYIRPQGKDQWALLALP